MLLKIHRALSNHKIYKDNEFFEIPHKKIAIALIKEKTGLSYKKISEHDFFKCSWFNIYASCKDAKKYLNFLDRVRKVLK